MEEANKVTTQDAKDNKEVKNDKVITPPKDDKSMPEWLTPIMSALGGMGGSYMLFIKPLQERMNTLADQVNNLRLEVKELQHQNKGLEKSLGEIEKNQSNAISNAINNAISNVPESVPNDYLPVKLVCFTSAPLLAKNQSI
ncbi:MAG: hypothetical protein ACYDCN_05130 [Bacteroidia bacterium]